MAFIVNRVVASLGKSSQGILRRGWSRNRNDFLRWSEVRNCIERLGQTREGLCEPLTDYIYAQEMHFL